MVKKSKISYCNALRLFIIAGLLISWQCRAEFELDFNTTPMCQSHGDPFSCMSGQTPFYSNFYGFGVPFDKVYDPATGLYYYHMMVGDPASGFVQESYIQLGSIAAATEAGCVGNTCSTSLNNLDPLGGTGSYYTGNGATNPRGAIIRQIISDGEVVMEFLKDQFSRKPLITQHLFTADLTATVEMDMRNSTYADINTPAVFTNLQTFTSPDVTSFDYARDKQNSFVTAGRYTYTNGTGPGGSKGTYNYLDGNAIFYDDWTSYMNIYDPRNVWSYSDNKPE